jgi:hypothetical protein
MLATTLQALSSPPKGLIRDGRRIFERLEAGGGGDVPTMIYVGFRDGREKSKDDIVSLPVFEVSRTDSLRPSCRGWQGDLGPGEGVLEWWTRDPSRINTVCQAGRNFRNIGRFQRDPYI